MGTARNFNAPVMAPSRHSVRSRRRSRRDDTKAATATSGDGFFLARDPQITALPPHPNAIDATICIATGVMTDRSARHRTRPEHDARPGNATLRIFNVLAVHDGLGWRWIESEHL